MRKIEENIEVTSQIVMAASLLQEVALPAMGDRIAFLPKKVGFGANSGSALPTSVAAGLYIQGLAVVGADQALPADLFGLERIIAFFSSVGQAGGAGVTLTSFGYYTIDVRELLFRELFLASICTNIATFQTVDISMLVDVYQLTTSEYVDLLD